LVRPIRKSIIAQVSVLFALADGVHDRNNSDPIYYEIESISATENGQEKSRNVTERIGGIQNFAKIGKGKGQTRGA
jgi:hypothetical protein